MQFSSSSYHVLALRPKQTPKRPFLVYHNSIFFPYGDRTCFQTTVEFIILHVSVIMILSEEQEAWTQWQQQVSLLTIKYALIVLVYVTLIYYCYSQNSLSRAVCITTGNGLDDRRVGVRVQVGSRIVTFPYRSDRPWGPHSLLAIGQRRLIPGKKAAGVWSSQLISYLRLGQENKDLYIHSPIRLLGLMLN
jgi:hypothetical protein